MKKYHSIIFLCAALLLPSSAIATEFQPGFLISDEELQDKHSMSRGDIAAFLKEKGGYISTLKIPDKDGTTRTTADIIYRASLEHAINPKYLLVKLQKEQSLVTAKNPTQKQLDGATGYGISDGCGWDCETYKRNKGFGKQVDSAAGIMRWYYENAKTQSFIKQAGVPYIISGQTVIPANDATAFLYTYTPHIQGNKNFWLLWQKWFDQVYPNGTLLKSAENDAVYLLQDGKRRAFANFTALTTRFDPKRIVTVPESELGRYPAGPAIALPNYAVVHSGSQYYLLDYDIIRPFASKAIVQKLGYHPDEVIQVTSKDLDGYEQGPIIGDDSENPLGELIRFPAGTIYYVKDKQLRLVQDPAIAKIALPHLTIVDVNDVSAYINLQKGESIGFPDGTLVMSPPSNKVYVIENGKRRHIASEEVFTGLGYDWNTIIRTTEFALQQHETGQPLYLRREVKTTTPTNEVAGQEEPTTENTSEVADLMVRTPKDEWSFIGTPFDTDIDAYLIADATSGEILFAKNIDTVRPLASLTKVMTAYQLRKDGLTLARSTTYDSTDHRATYHRFRIADGEQVKNLHLMQAMLISSLNSPARMLVDSVEEHEPTFIANMNATARELGLKKTTFVDVSGENERTVTTAREFLAIWQKAANNRDVRTMLNTRTYEYDEVLDIDGNAHHYDDHSNDLLKKSLPYTIGPSKTGYLYESGANLMMEVTDKTTGTSYLMLTMGNVDHANRFAEPDRLARWVLAQ